jgi:hypothetical protein
LGKNSPNLVTLKAEAVKGAVRPRDATKRQKEYINACIRKKGAQCDDFCKFAFLPRNLSKNGGIDSNKLLFN